MGAQHHIGASKGVAIANNIEALRTARGWSRPELARRMKTSGQQVERLEKGQRKLSHEWMEKAAEAFGVTAAAIISAELGDLPPPAEDEEPVDAIDMVGIQHIDMAYGMGATFAVDYPDIEILQFPKQWVETISRSPPSMLTWTRGRGDSMEPTIKDGDLIMIDRSDRAVGEPDQLWAFTVGDQAAIKRLRRKGNRYELHSDNQSVRVDEEPADTVHIVGRVVFVGSRK